MIFTADIHCHAYKAFATFENEQNTRLTWCIKALRDLGEYALSKKTSLVIGGDLFHERGKISVRTFNGVYEALRQLKEKGLETIILAGNHDQAGLNDGESALRSLSDLALIVEYPQVIDGIGYVPYRENHDDYLHDLDSVRKASVLVTHIGVMGGVVGESYVPPGQISPEVFDGFDLTLMGHYHKHQWVTPSVVYPGSPLSHDFGDANDIKGFLDLTKDNPEDYFVETSFPKFVTHKISSPDDLEDIDFEDGNYHKVISETDQRISLPPHVNLTLRPPKERKARFSIGIDSTEEDILKAYLDHKEADPALLEVGMGILGGAKAGAI